MYWTEEWMGVGVGLEVEVEVSVDVGGFALVKRGVYSVIAREDRVRKKERKDKVK